MDFKTYIGGNHWRKYKKLIELRGNIMYHNEIQLSMA